MPPFLILLFQFLSLSAAVTILDLKHLVIVEHVIHMPLPPPMLGGHHMSRCAAVGTLGGHVAGAHVDGRLSRAH